MIVDPLAEWTNNTTTGLYEDVIVRVMRIEKRTNIVNTIKRVRHDEINDNILCFYGWQEQSDFYYFAYEKCEHTLEEYVGLHNFTEFSGSKQLRLDIISGGSYKFSDQDLGDNELKFCKIVEARDLIEKILSDRMVGLQHVLGHHLFWSTLERISFVVDFSNHIGQVGVKAAISRSIAKKIEHNKVFENRWDRNYLPDKLVKAMDENASNLGLPSYIYTVWISLLRFMKNAFNHYNSIPENIRDEIAPSKGALDCTRDYLVQ
ncbi:serine/threonine-protein kinase/endoribonuclease IRE1a-like protein [Tanacetum coccineum]